MKNIVTIGGGTGSFTLLNGLKNYNVDISAIVTMADDGGSTGILRDELGVLPPGDVRQCLVALSESSDTLRRLMNYRFEKGGLKGHNFGNLLLSTLEMTEGSFFDGLQVASKILNIKGKVVPVSESKMHLAIELKNNQVMNGESNLDDSEEIRKIGVKKVYLSPRVKTSKLAIETIHSADLIVIGPGDHYGSIVPNLITDGISSAIEKSKAKLVYVCNLTNKKGQTDDFDQDDYVRSINSYFGRDVVDYCLVPTGTAPKELVERYERKEGEGSVIDFKDIKKKNRSYKIIKAKILKSNKEKNRRLFSVGHSSFIRHDSVLLAKAVIEILESLEGQVIKEVI